jgi:hypothetical protein
LRGSSCASSPSFISSLSRCASSASRTTRQAALECHPQTGRLPSDGGERAVSSYRMILSPTLFRASVALPPGPEAASGSRNTAPFSRGVGIEDGHRSMWRWILRHPPSQEQFEKKNGVADVGSWPVSCNCGVRRRQRGAATWQVPLTYTAPIRIVGAGTAAQLHHDRGIYEFPLGKEASGRLMNLNKRDAQKLESSILRAALPKARSR